jgi:hypothetical protein
MNLLKEFEEKIESILEGFFTRQFRTGVQPVELAKALIKEVEREKKIGISKFYAPNQFQILLSQRDEKRLRPVREPLLKELEAFVSAHAKREGYLLANRIKVEITTDQKLELGEFKVLSNFSDENFRERPAATKIIEPKEKPSPKPYLVLRVGDSQRDFPLTKREVRIGRAKQNDIIVPDLNVSRKHALIIKTEQGYLLKDLESTNGTYLNGERIKEKFLKPDDVIKIGNSILSFKEKKEC